MAARETTKRYALIDALRGFWLLNMLGYHFCFDIFHIYGVDTGWMFTPGAVAWERCICFGFILISGVSVNFSSRPVRRGLIVSAFGLLMTAVTLLVLPSFVIWFGVLSLIGAAMMIVGALRKPLGKIHPAVGASVSLALFALLFKAPFGWMGFFDIKLLKLPGWLYQNYLTAFLGFPPKGFYSSDFFPPVPWLFLFAAGFFLWRLLVRCKADRFFLRPVPVLSAIGRYTLWIYLAHQPLLMGICFLIFGHF